MQGGLEVSVEELTAEIASCKRLFFGGGGVTFTGGECTMQKAALKEVLKGCRKENINTAIETNGTCPYDEELFDDIDLIICDFKHHDEEKLQTAVGNVKGYKKNIRDYLQSRKPVLVRIPLIHGFNDEPGDDIRFAKFFENLPTENTKFEFLSYHEYGKVKWEKLNMPYKMQDAFVNKETVDLFENTFKTYNLKTIRS